ncbi:AGAP004235-PC [Anopheles gambiae str. PEST]|uniref:AGAP004235-PC n=3 Tax=gambiae species complex TaxID=44542 RepID=F5HL61_ANOGA|nr:probable elongation factor 1-delta isoform X1 [Anopheles coluzzii]EGK97023.1 AGAP004235-PC [Anopheles gambiae str. PEST]
MAAAAMAHEKLWTEKSTMDAAEKAYHEYMSKLSAAGKMESSDGVAAGSKIEQPKKGGNAAAPQQTQQQQQRQQQQGQPRKMDVASVESSPPPAAAADAPKSKKDKKKKNKGKKESTPTDTESSEKAASTDAVPEPQPPVAEPAEVQKETGKKKSKKSKKSKSQEDPSSVQDNDNKYQETVQQQNAKNQKEKENLAHKLCDNITEELNKINSVPSQCTLASEISKARQHIKNSLERMDGIAALAASPGAELLDRLSSVEKENEKLRSIIDGLNNLVIDLHERVRSLESGSGKSAAPAKPAAAATKPAALAKKAEAEDDDDDVDLFGSEDEDEDKAAAELREKRLAEYAAKKSKKPALIAKSNVILDIKPWDDETDMKVMEQEVRKISADGLLLGAAKLVPLAYGIHKLQMSCVIEDDKISVDWLQEEIEKIEDYVQSVDIAAFNKI